MLGKKRFVGAGIGLEFSWDFLGFPGIGVL
jgi:hypothetical protein